MSTCPRVSLPWVVDQVRKSVKPLVSPAPPKRRESPGFEQFGACATYNSAVCCFPQSRNYQLRYLKRSVKDFLREFGRIKPKVFVPQASPLEQLL